jgi:hypothetical protein
MPFLTGQVVVITKAPFGALSRFEATGRVTDYGGRVESRVTKNTTLLLTDEAEMARIRAGADDMTTKSAEAIKRGVRILTGDDFERVRTGAALLLTVGYVADVAPKPLSKTAQMRQQRAQANALDHRISECFGMAPSTPYSADF